MTYDSPVKINLAQNSDAEVLVGICKDAFNTDVELDSFQNSFSSTVKGLTDCNLSTPPCHNSDFFLQYTYIYMFLAFY
jgi:hypothetical protein